MPANASQTKPKTETESLGQKSLFASICVCVCELKVFERHLVSREGWSVGHNKETQDWYRVILQLLLLYFLLRYIITKLYNSIVQLVIDCKDSFLGKSWSLRLTQKQSNKKKVLTGKGFNWKRKRSTLWNDNYAYVTYIFFCSFCT